MHWSPPTLSLCTGSFAPKCESFTGRRNGLSPSSVRSNTSTVLIDAYTASSFPKTQVEGERELRRRKMAMEAKSPRRAASSPAGSSPFSLTSSQYDLTVLAGDRAGRGAGDYDLERQLPERFAEEGGRNGRGGNRKLLSWVFPLLALPAVLTLAAFVVVGFHRLVGSSRFVFLFLLLVMAAGVALCYRRLPSIRFFDGRSWHRNFRSGRGSSGRGGQGVRWLIGEEDDDWGRNEGKGVKKYDNGDFYEGEFRRGKCHGRGVRRFSQGGRYEGDWVEGLVEGFGVEIFPVGSRYRGQYKEGTRSGYGKMSMYTGEWYAGEWLAGRPNGYGVHRSPRGSSYYGEFKNGEKHGSGRSNFWYQFFVAFFFFGVLVLICVFLLQWLMNVISWCCGNRLEIMFSLLLLLSINVQFVAASIN